MVFPVTQRSAADGKMNAFGTSIRGAFGDDQVGFGGAEVL